MESSSSLSFLLTLPLLGMVVSFIAPKGILRIFAIFSSLLFFGLTAYECAALLFTQSAASAQALVIEHKLAWVPELGASLSLRLDSTSVWFILLNALVAVIAFSTRGSWYRKSPKLFTGLGFFLVFALNAAFLSGDLILFYLSYEAVFIPMIFMVGVWGENQKAAAVFRFFLMSFFGSILMLVSIFYLIYRNHQVTGVYSSHLPDLLRVAATLTPTQAFWVMLGFFTAFSIKVPLVPLHGWLKDVYVNAPAPATIWMSAILSKLGVYGMLRFVLPLFQETLLQNQGWLVSIAALSVVYPAFLAIQSNQPKALLAYSSISHLGFVMLGVFTLKPGGASAAILLSAGHTLVSALLFFLLAQIEERSESVDLSATRGLAKRFPILFATCFVALLASVSLPGTLNFAGEFLVLLNAYPVSALCTIVAGLGVILGAVYMLKFYQQLAFGPAQETGNSGGRDLGGYDLALVMFLLLALVYCGFQVGIFLKGN